MKKNKVIRFVDLFAGIGGIRKGLELSLEKMGIEGKCVFSSEIHRQSQETYKLNFGEKPSGDIKTIDHLPEHDVLLAGFPCQAFSYAGKQKGFGDTRGTLFFEVERLLSSLKNKPKLLLLENVRGFTTHDGGRTFATVKSRLENLGYAVNALLLNSSNFDVPQNRVRVYLVCELDQSTKISIRSDLGSNDSHDFKRKKLQGSFDLFSKSNYKCVHDILLEKVDDKYLCSEQFRIQLADAIKGKPFESLHGFRLIDHRGGNSIHSWELGTKGHCTDTEKEFLNLLIENRRRKEFGVHQDGKSLTINQIKTFWRKDDLYNLLEGLVRKGYLRKDNGEKYNPTCGNMSFEVFKFLDPHSISITIVTSDAHRLGVVHNGIPRRITPRECARIQGFPDSFILHPNDTWAYKQIGNSVSVPVITAIFSDLQANGCSVFQ
jgi:DNA (cytosine-5)-methyltransferase 1